MRQFPLWLCILAILLMVPVFAHSGAAREAARNRHSRPAIESVGRAADGDAQSENECGSSEAGGGRTKEAGGWRACPNRVGDEESVSQGSHRQSQAHRKAGQASAQ